MNPELSKILEECGAILRGHFLLTSGRHSNVYIEKFRLLERPEIISRLCRDLSISLELFKPEVIVGPTTGGVLVAFELARQLGCEALYVEQEDGVRKLRRGGALRPGSRIVIVDDVLTTGRSLCEVKSALTAFDPVVVAYAVLIDRSESLPDLEAQLFAGIRVKAESWDSENLPEELRKLPISKPGTRNFD